MPERRSDPEKLQGLICAIPGCDARCAPYRRSVRPRVTCSAAHAKLLRRVKITRANATGGGKASACEFAMTLEQISRVFNISRERVRQIEATALKKCRIAAETMGMRELLEWIDEREAREGEYDMQQMI